ncbi:hypothetical protein ST201phi2-1p134 [Pseudomonas phage 201phi2-1]|uniref:Uncharacterized protein n=1 Tax=Pseudomonas phage 201phi2-1 TaxID=198110 RepID=B3FIZ7_BP201|nr:hypothetical protein ST201phi2-1p134 [Pseudomonas phage 201phi2-1]ABY62966.1 hypothetical protein 201phi2-1p134 [Pseudomonas phage 201phi2-1]
MMNVVFKYRMKVKADSIFDLTNRGYVVNQNDCVEGEFWLLTNSPKYLTSFVESDGFEVVVAAEEIPMA